MSGLPVDCLCMATSDSSCDFKPKRFQRRPVGPFDVLIDMKFVGICHTDLHAAAGDAAALMGSYYPCVPGHELAGVVSAVGSSVTRAKVGDAVGVGCMVDSCLACAACLRGEEQKCSKQVSTYNGKDKSGRAATYPAGGHTLGGYTTKFVVHERFAVIIPPSYPLQFAGPVMCAGVTLFDPLRRYHAGPGVRVGVVGIGGLGQMGLKLAKALGAHVTAITRGTSKAAFATSCGADRVISSTDALAFAAAAGTIDLLLNTIPSEHDYMAYQPLLSRTYRGACQVMLGLNTGLVAGFAVDAMCCGTSRVKGSGIGGIEATQAVIDLCAANNIRPNIEVVAPEGINGVYERLDDANPTGVRYVVDLSTLNEESFAKCAEVPPPKLVKHAPITACGLICSILGLLCCCGYRR